MNEGAASQVETERIAPKDGIAVNKVVRELLLTGVVSLTAFLVIHFSIENVRIDGRSMSPTLVNGQHLIANKLLYIRVLPKHGDIIITRYPENPSKSVVKRVIGLPQDVIEIDFGRVIRNGEPLDEPYVIQRDTRSFDTVEVPDSSYYVLGDNRMASNDSRHWGFVSDDQIIGRVWYSYWPSDKIVFLHGPW